MNCPSGPVGYTAPFTAAANYRFILSLQNDRCQIVSATPVSLFRPQPASVRNPEEFHTKVTTSMKPKHAVIATNKAAHGFLPLGQVLVEDSFLSSQFGKAIADERLGVLEIVVPLAGMAS